MCNIADLTYKSLWLCFKLRCYCMNCSTGLRRYLLSYSKIITIHVVALLLLIVDLLLQPYVWLLKKQYGTFFSLFLAFGICRFCVVIRFFHPCHNGQWPPTSKDFYSRLFPLHCLTILILEKEPVFPFLMLSAKQGDHWYHLFTSFVWHCLYQGMIGPPALEAVFTKPLKHLFPLFVWGTTLYICMSALPFG